MLTEGPLTLTQEGIPMGILYRRGGEEAEGQEGFEAFLRNGLMMERRSMLMVREGGGGTTAGHTSSGRDDRRSLLQQ